MATTLTLLRSIALGFVASAIISCDGAGPGSAVAGATNIEDLPTEAKVTISGTRFTMELALDPNLRHLGLSGREVIADDGGMLFVFPDVQQRSFVMRDCPIAIDIAFLDGNGRVVAIHEMQPETPRGENESAFEYEGRLTHYSSRFGSQFAVETAGGRLRAVGLEVGDRIQFDAERLKTLAR